MPPALHTRSASRPQRVVCLSMGIESSFQDMEGAGVGHVRVEGDNRKERGE